MRELGRHILVEMYDCDRNLLNNQSFIRENMLAAAEKAGATIIGDTFHSFSPHGVSGAVVIAESHLSIHTWPEYGFAALDLFTCGTEVDPWLAFHHLAAELKAGSTSQVEIKRGLFPFAQDVRHPFKPVAVVETPVEKVPCC